MGGPGSGPRPGQHDDEVCDYASLDVRELARAGLLAPGDHEWMVEGSGLGVAVLLHVPRSGDCIRIGIRPGVFDATVLLHRVPTKLASRPVRTWFECSHCPRRCAVLYIRKGRWACRVCLGLKYPTTRLRPIMRGLEKARATRVKLGGGPGCGHLFPPKPPGMRWATYERLKTETWAAEWRWIREVAAPRCERSRRCVAAVTGDDW